jgi:hypothetical protein
MDALRRHVRQTLCARDGLDPDQTPLHEAVIRRAGLPCGLFFQVRGPRLLTSYAVWGGPERRILFYDAAGERFAESRLRTGPGLEGLAVGEGGTSRAVLTGAIALRPHST